MRENKKVFLLFLMAGFFIGIIYANTISRDYVDAIGIFNEYFLKQYTKTDVNTKEYIWYLSKLRFVPMLLLSGLGLTKLRKGVVLGFLVWTGFLGGLIVASSIIKLGIIGVPFCITAFFPQLLFYGAAYVILLWSIYEYPRTRWNTTKVMIIFLITIIGVLAECHINPILLKMFLKRV